MVAIKQIYQHFLESKGISTDTRTLLPGQIFLALKGDRFDGNQHVAKALEKGASFCIVDDSSLEKQDQLLLVEDGLACLQELANYHRLKFDVPVLAITGSNGKTTTKELIASVLSKKYNVLYTHGNLNNHIGVPLTLLRAKSDIDFMIIEMGANHVGEIATLCEIALPDAGLITNIGQAHLEGFGGIEGVIQGKTEMYRHLSKHDGTIFINMDDDVLVKQCTELKKLVQYFESDYELKYDKESHIQLDDGQQVITTHLVGDYNLANVVAAIAVAKHYDVAQADVYSAIAEYIPKINRSQKMEKNDNTYILDAYNANPSSMKESIMSFAKMEGKKRLILGEMLELGKYSDIEHEKLVQLVNSYEWASVWLVGKEFENIALDKNIKHFDDIHTLNKWKQDQCIDTEQVYLLKGSRGVKLENFVDLTE